MPWTASFDLADRKRAMSGAFAGKVVVITGASDGVDAERAKQLASSKAMLVLAARRVDAPERVAGSCRRSKSSRPTSPCKPTASA